MRVISRLDIKNNDLIKGLNFEGLRKLGNAKDFAKEYYKKNADEIMYIDTVASLYSSSGAIQTVEDALL